MKKVLNNLIWLVKVSFLLMTAAGISMMLSKRGILICFLPAVFCVFRGSDKSFLFRNYIWLRACIIGYLLFLILANVIPLVSSGPGLDTDFAIFVSVIVASVMAWKGMKIVGVSESVLRFSGWFSVLLILVCIVFTGVVFSYGRGISYDIVLSELIFVSVLVYYIKKIISKTVPGSE